MTVTRKGYLDASPTVSLPAGEQVRKLVILQPIKPLERKKKGGIGRILPVLLGVGLLLGLLSGKGGGGAPNVSGTVLDSLTLQPISGVHVQIGNAGDTSDSDGIYSLSLPEGNYPVSATDPSGNYEFDPLQDTTLVVATEPITLDIYMRPLGPGPAPPQPPPL